MSDFTNTEILNEVAKLIGGEISYDRDGGLIDVTTSHRQILDTAAISLLLNADAVFYLCDLIKNSLLSVVRQEVRILEDILVALDQLSVYGEQVENTTDISNATTALVELDAAGSVQGRNELDRFTRSMDKFSESLRPNTIYSSRVVRTRESARGVIVANSQSLSGIHDRLLRKVNNILALLTNFNALDLPTLVSNSTFSKVRDSLNSMQEDLSSADSNAYLSRISLLRSLAAKVVVNMVASFKDPSELKYRSPTKPIPAGTAYYGRVTGEGTPASVLTTSGPWELPLDDLVLKVDGGTSQTISLVAVIGAIINGRHEEDFVVTTSRRYIHALVDPDVLEDTTSSAGTVNQAQITNTSKSFGFKHLRSTAHFPDKTGTDAFPRVIDHIYSYRSAGSCTWNPSNNTITGTFSTSLAAGDVGKAFLDRLGNYFEITAFISSTVIEIDPRGQTPADGAGTCYVCGSDPSTGLFYFHFAPDLTLAVGSGDSVNLGPSMKSTTLTAGTRTAAQVIADLNNESSTIHGDYPGSLGAHVEAREVSGEPDKVALMLRNKLDPYLQVTSVMGLPDDATPGNSLVQESAHEIIGFLDGELDTDTLLTPAELAAAVNDQATGVLASVEEEIIVEGSLSTLVDTYQVTDSTVDFESLGVLEGFALEIQEGFSTGVYRIESVSGSNLTARLFRNQTFESSENNLPYVIYSQKVKLASTNAGPGSSLEVVSGPSEFGLVAGEQLGSVPYFEAVDKRGNNLSFDSVLSGDSLKVVGEDAVEISYVDGTLLSLSSGLPSDTENTGFEITGGGAKAYSEMISDLDTFMVSRNLFGKYDLNESVEEVLSALTVAILPGQRFASNINSARRLVSDLLSLLSTDYRRSDEYSTSIPTAALNLEDILRGYSAQKVEAVDNLIDGLEDRRYDRAVALLLDGRLFDFFSTTYETASNSGNVTQAGRFVYNDLPSNRVSEEGAREQSFEGTIVNEDPDPDEDFSDTVFEDIDE